MPASAASTSSTARTGSAPTIPARPPIARTWTPTSGRWPTSGSSSSPEPSLRGAERGPPLSRKRQARGRPFKQALAAEAEQLGRAPAGLGVPAAEALDQVGALEPPAEILLVQGDPGDRLHCALELREGELGGRELERDRPVPELAAQTAKAGGED